MSLPQYNYIGKPVTPKMAVVCTCPDPPAGKPIICF